MEENNQSKKKDATCTTRTRIPSYELIPTQYDHIKKIVEITKTGKTFSGSMLMFGINKRPGNFFFEHEFIFCEEFDTTMALFHKYRGNDWKPIFGKDTYVFFDYVSCKEADSLAKHHTHTLFSNQVKSMDVDEAALYSYEPIRHNNGTLCKPAWLVLRDLFNFLFISTQIMRRINDKDIPLIKLYVNKFVEKFVRVDRGKYCISESETANFFEYGKKLFADVISKESEYEYHYLFDFRKMLPAENSRKLILSSVKPGILKYHREMIDESEQHNFIISPQYPINDFAYVPFVREYDALCLLTHNQDACATVGRCALRFIENSKYAESDFCDAKPIEENKAVKDKEIDLISQPSTDGNSDGSSLKQQPSDAGTAAELVEASEEKLKKKKTTAPETESSKIAKPSQNIDSNEEEVEISTSACEPELIRATEHALVPKKAHDVHLATEAGTQKKIKYKNLQQMEDIGHIEWKMIHVNKSDLREFDGLRNELMKKAMEKIMLEFDGVGGFGFRKNEDHSSLALDVLFCEEVGLYIAAVQRWYGINNGKPTFGKDTDVFFNYVSFKEAHSLFGKYAYGNAYSSLKYIPEVEVALYSYEPIMHNSGTLCKPAYLVLRDLFNFLFISTKVLQNINDQHIPLIKKFVNEFVEKFVRLDRGKYCISDSETADFFEYGKQLFADVVSKESENGYQYLVDFRTVLPAEISRKYILASVKPGILKYQRQMIDESEKNNFIISPWYPINDFAFVPFVRECEALCLFTHSQEACATVGRCALRFIENSKYTENDFCGPKNTEENQTVKEKEIVSISEPTTNDDSDSPSEPTNDRCSSDGSTSVESVEASKEKSKKRKATALETGSSKIAKPSQSVASNEEEVEMTIVDIEKEPIQATESAVVQRKTQEVTISAQAGTSMSEIRRKDKIDTQLESPKLELEKMEKNLTQQLSKMQNTLDELLFSQKQTNEKMKEQEDKTNEWKLKYEEEVRRKMASTSTTPHTVPKETVEYYQRRIEEGTDLIIAARNELEEFRNNTDVRSDIRRAETEFEDCERVVLLNIRRAQRNVDTLEEDEDAGNDQFLKVEKFPLPFSAQTYFKMGAAKKMRLAMRDANPESN